MVDVNTGHSVVPPELERAYSAAVAEFDAERRAAMWELTEAVAPFRHLYPYNSKGDAKKYYRLAAPHLLRELHRRDAAAAKLREAIAALGLRAD